MAFWFTSDLHFDHPWCAEWRGFEYVTEMDQRLIQRWNEVVNRSDVVYCLGDFYWSDNVDYISNILRRLNGTVNFVKGNHDRWIKKYKTYVNPNMGLRRLWHRRIHETHFVMCHYPMWTWNRKDHGSIHLHGHSHGKTIPRVNMLDVGVDSAKIILGEYRPFSLDEVLYLTNTTKPEGRY